MMKIRMKTKVKILIVSQKSNALDKSDNAQVQTLFGEKL